MGRERLRVGIDGPTASGKTTFGHELAAAIAGRGRSVLRASLDDFKKPWKDRHLYDRESAEGYYRNAFDYTAAKRLLLEPFGPNSSGVTALCSIDPITQTDHSELVVHASYDAVLIVDGVFAFRPELNRYWNYRVWLHVAPEISVERATRRDRANAGAGARALVRDRYLPSERIYFYEVHPVDEADVVIDNTTFEAPRVDST